MTDEMRTWLDNLKKGEEVILCSCYMAGQPMNVHRTTPTQIIILEGGHELRYLKRNGRRIGPSSGWLIMPSEVTK